MALRNFASTNALALPGTGKIDFFTLNSQAETESRQPEIYRKAGNPGERGRLSAPFDKLMKEHPMARLTKLILRHAVVATVVTTASASSLALQIRDAASNGHLGLYRADEFRLADGDCRDCRTIPQALWYFRGETIAVPKTEPNGFSRRTHFTDDLRAWVNAEAATNAANELPPLVWIGSPSVVEAAYLEDGGKAIGNGTGPKIPFAVTRKIDSNLSYYNETSLAHLTGRSLKLRGRSEDGRFIARVVWPHDYSIASNLDVNSPLRPGETIESMVRADGKNPTAALAARVLWARNDRTNPGELAGKPVMAFILNGAQGDDDEAHGGHFAVATGRLGPNGEWSDWVVNNFYNLGSISEKGIIAATLPMDAYMGDFNSGQAWYRPSYMLVAVLRDHRAPALFQNGIGRVYNHFYRHDFSYRHASANCSGISVDSLRALGWSVPEQGSDGRLKAAIALPYVAIKDMSIESGKKAFDYLSTERTRLYPFVAFNAIGHDLVDRIAPGKVGSGKLERLLAEDIEALLYVRIPQFPSSRAFGQAPVASLDEYMDRAPADRSQWKIVPVGPREFPRQMLDSDIPGDPLAGSEIALWTYCGIAGFAALGAYRRRRGGQARI